MALGLGSAVCSVRAGDPCFSRYRAEGQRRQVDLFFEVSEDFAEGFEGNKVDMNIGDLVKTQCGTGRIVEVKRGQCRTLVLVLYAPLTFPRWHDARYIRSIA